MHCIIRKRNGEYYTSAIFGSYLDVVGEERRWRWADRYYYVFDESKTKLIKQPGFFCDKRPHLDTAILLFDVNEDRYVFDEDDDGCLDFLSKEKIEHYVQMEFLPSEILEQCKKYDETVMFHETVEIKTQEDIDRLMLIAGNFHDARIGELKENYDHTVSLLMVDCWGCSIKLEFAGAVAYNIEGRDPE